MDYAAAPGCAMKRGRSACYSRHEGGMRKTSYLLVSRHHKRLLVLTWWGCKLAVVLWWSGSSSKCTLRLCMPRALNRGCLCLQKCVLNWSYSLDGKHRARID